MIENAEPKTDAGVKSNLGKSVMPFFSMICEKKFVNIVNKINGMNLAMSTVTTTVV